MEKCYCKEILEAEFGGTARLVVHLSGCPESYYAREYKKMNWWKKLWNVSPQRLYKEHLRILTP